MAVSITAIFRGTTPGDGTGDTAYAGSGIINTNFTNVKTEVDKVLDITSDRLLGRDTVGAGDPEEITVGGGLEFTGSGGVQRSALTGDVTASAGSNATTIANSAVTLAKMADVATSTVFYRKTAATGVPEVQTLATLKTDLGLTGTNSGDQTSMSGISDTKANFNAACSDGTFLYVGDVTSYTHPNHTGHVTSTGDGATVLTLAAITGQTDIGAAIAGTDELIINDDAVGIRRTDMSRVATYVEGAIAHQNISGSGTNTHAQIDTHLGLTNAHIDWTSTTSNFSTSGTAATGALTVTGAITATGDITAFFTSDIALKQNIEPITSALDKVSRLNGSRFQYKKKEGTFYGLMAQDMREVLPELVHENADGELTIRMAGFELVALLVEAIKELKEKVDARNASD